MRVTLFLLGLLCVGVLKSQDFLSVDLTFKIKGLPPTEEVMLAYHYGDKQYIRKELGTSANGQFNYKSDSVDPGLYLLHFKQANTYVEFILNEPVFSINTEYEDLNGKVGSIGSRENALFFSLLGQNQSLNARLEQVQNNTELTEAARNTEMGKLGQELSAFRNKIITENPKLLISDLLKASMEPVIPNAPSGLSEEEAQLFRYYYYRDHYFDNVNFKNTALLRSPVINNMLQTFRKELTTQHPDSLLKAANHIIGLASENPEIKKYLIIDFFNFFAKSTVVCMDKAYVNMADKYYLSGIADWVEQEQLDKIVANANNLRNNLCGQKAFNFTLRDKDNNSVELNSIKAEWTILVFLKSDCSHCNQELESLKALNLPGVDYKILTVHLKEDSDWLKQMADYNDSRWISLKDFVGVIEWKRQYNLSSFPLIYVLDKDKVIRYKKLTAEQIGQIISNQ